MRDSDISENRDQVTFNSFGHPTLGGGVISPRNYHLLLGKTREHLAKHPPRNMPQGKPGRPFSRCPALYTGSDSDLQRDYDELHA